MTGLNGDNRGKQALKKEPCKKRKVLIFPSSFVVISLSSRNNSGHANNRCEKTQASNNADDKQRNRLLQRNGCVEIITQQAQTLDQRPYGHYRRCNFTQFANHLPLICKVLSNSNARSGTGQPLKEVRHRAQALMERIFRIRLEVDSFTQISNRAALILS